MEQDFKDWIGRSVTRCDVVTERLITQYRATMAPYLFETQPDVGPPGLHFGLAPPMPASGDTGPDGAERKGIFLPPIALPRRMWAGGAIETFRPIRAGARVTRVSTLADIRLKQGRSGQLCLVAVRHDISDEQGPCIRERQDLVFREAAGIATPQLNPSQNIAAEWQVEATPLLLFRFSAFTFNGHLIHYDLAHAKEEGYPGLLVHGPLQAALMLNLAARRMGQVPDRFIYRCLAPLYGGERLGVSFEMDGAHTRIIRGDGVTAAEGQALAQGTG